MHPHLPQRSAWTWAAAAKTSWSLQVNHSAKPCRTTMRNQQPSTAFDTLPLPNLLIITFRANDS